MKKIIPLVLIFLFIGCCPTNYIFYSVVQNEFAGVWQIGNNENGILTITPEDDQAYSLKFVNGDVEWEGMGYQYHDKLIAVFRYKGIEARGYVTFTMVNMNKINFVSINPNGQVRASLFYTRLK